MNRPLVDISEDMIKDCAEFSNFAQYVKMKYWDTCDFAYVTEYKIDKILLTVWKYYDIKPKE